MFDLAKDGPRSFGWPLANHVAGVCGLGLVNLGESALGPNASDKVPEVCVGLWPKMLLGVWVGV